MTSAILDAIDSHIQRGNAVFGEITAAPFLPSPGGSNTASPTLCTATIASLASTVNALARRVARLETTCVMLESRFIGASPLLAGNQATVDALDFSKALSVAMRPIREALAQHDVAIQRIASHLSEQQQPSAKETNIKTQAVNAAAPSKFTAGGVSVTPPDKEPPDTSADADEVNRRLENLVRRLREERTVPQAGGGETSVVAVGSPAAGGYSSSSANPAMTATTGTSSSDRAALRTYYSSSTSTEGALRILWGQPSRRHHPPSAEASAVLPSGGSNDVSADEAQAVLSSLHDGVARPLSTDLYRSEFGSGGIFDRVRGILAGEEGSDGSSHQLL